MEWLTVGQMAELNRVSEQTLRLYDREGLLSPAKRGENGYRYYNIKQSAVLDMIRHMKSLGMQLKDIKIQLSNKDLGYLEAVLHQKQKQIDEEIRELKVQRRAVERTLESYERFRAAPPDGTVVLEYIGRRQMYCIDTGVNFYDHGIEVYEEVLAELRSRLSKDHLPQIYFCNAGTVLHREDLLKRRFFSTEVFVFVDREFVPDNLISTIPASNYLCIYCNSFHKEKEYAERLLERAERDGLTVCGDYLCETVAELPVVGVPVQNGTASGGISGGVIPGRMGREPESGGGERGMFLRLQIPVRFG